jgi:acyl-CoA dehydrogenase
VIGGESNSIPFGAHATHAVLAHRGEFVLAVTRPAGPDLFGTGGALALEVDTVLDRLDLSAESVQLAAAAVASAQMAGAMARVMDMTLGYAADRQQFGRSLSKFQAIQQQLAVLAEQVISAQVAARSAFVGAEFDPVRVAAAKCRCNEAAALVCGIAHAIHGAIGVTEEFDLQLYTRRIKQWQLAFGSESYWGARLGRARVRADTATTADFLRLNLAHVEA